MKTLSIGRLNYDINIFMEEYPKENTKNVTKEIVSCSGSSASVIAYALGKWNMESFISGVVGYDEIGNAMKKDMEENHVKTTYLETNYDIKTPASYILVNKQNNSHTKIVTELNKFNIRKFDYDQSMDCIITDGNEYNAFSYAIGKFNNAISILNAKMPHQELLDYFKIVKYVVCSKEVAEAIMGMKIDYENPISMSTIYKKMMDKYPHITLFITIPGRGTIYSLNNEIKVLATMNGEALDETGARDVFVAMISYGLTNDYDLETTIRLATIAENMSKKSIGATLSIPILSDIINFYESKFGKIQKNEEINKENVTEVQIETTTNHTIQPQPVSTLNESMPTYQNTIEQPSFNPFAGTIFNEEKTKQEQPITPLVQNQAEEETEPNASTPR